MTGRHAERVQGDDAVDDPSLKQHLRFRGWHVAGGSAVIQAMHSGLIIQSFGNYAVLLQQQFGWSKTTISGCAPAR